MKLCFSSRERTGGLAGILAGLTFLFGMVFYLALLTEVQFGNLSADITSQLIYLQEHSGFLYTWYFVIYLVFGFALLNMQFGLSALVPRTTLSQAASLVAYLWAGLVISAGLVATVGHNMVITLAQAHPELAPGAFVSLHIVVNGLGGGNELVGGVWLILVFFCLTAEAVIARVYSVERTVGRFCRHGYCIAAIGRVLRCSIRAWRHSLVRGHGYASGF
jgi:hypothetical protein